MKCSLLIGTQPLPLLVFISCPIPPYRPGRRSLQLGLSGYYRYKWSSSVKPISLIRAIKTSVQHRSPVKCVRLIFSPCPSCNVFHHLPPSLTHSFLTSVYLRLSIYRTFNLVNTCPLPVLILTPPTSLFRSYIPLPYYPSPCLFLPLSFYHQSRETRRQTPPASEVAEGESAGASRAWRSGCVVKSLSGSVHPGSIHIYLSSQLTLPSVIRIS